MAKTTYKDAGLDLEKYAQAMSRLPALAGRTFSAVCPPSTGRICRAVSVRLHQSPLRPPLPGAGPRLLHRRRGHEAESRREPAGIHNTVGIDLVAMSVNDALCCGAEPLFFLDYVAMPKRRSRSARADRRRHHRRLSRRPIAPCWGARRPSCPTCTPAGDYDLAGFCVGVVERRRVIDGRAIAAGDVVIGMASSGLHSNGFSLVAEGRLRHRRAKSRQTTSKRSRPPWARRCWRRRGFTFARCGASRRTTRSRKSCTALPTSPAAACTRTSSRILPEGTQAVIERGSWNVPPIFPWLQRLGESTRRNGPRLQHGPRHGAGRQPVLCREHPAATRRQRSRSVDDRPHGRRPAWRRVGVSGLPANASTTCSRPADRGGPAASGRSCRSCGSAPVLRLWPGCSGPLP